jgi:hypothetical protein
MTGAAGQAVIEIASLLSQQYTRQKALAFIQKVKKKRSSGGDPWHSGLCIFYSVDWRAVHALAALALCVHHTINHEDLWYDAVMMGKKKHLVGDPSDWRFSLVNGGILGIERDGFGGKIRAKIQLLLPGGNLIPHNASSLLSAQLHYRRSF